MYASLEDRKRRQTEIKTVVIIWCVYVGDLFYFSPDTNRLIDAAQKHYMYGKNNVNVIFLHIKMNINCNCKTLFFFES